MLRQIQVRYDVDEDRLVVWVHSGTEDHPDVRALHLTRRVWARARPDVQALIDASAQVPQQASAQMQRQLSRAHHQAQTAHADVQHNQPVPCTQNKRPELVKAVRCGRRAGDGKWLLDFVLSGDRLGLLLRDSTLHAVINALLTQEAKAGWQLPELPAAAALPESKEHASQLH